MPDDKKNTEGAVEKRPRGNPACKNTGKDHPGYGNVSNLYHKKYSPTELYEKAEEYFQSKDEDEVKLITSRGDNAKGRLKMPYSFAGFSNFIGVSHYTIYKYRFGENYKDFWPVMQWVASMIEERLIEGGLLNLFNPRMAEFVLKNLRMRPEQYADKVEVEKTEHNFQKIDVHIVRDRADIKKLEADSINNKRELGIDVDNIKKVEGETINVEPIKK